MRGNKFPYKNFGQQLRQLRERQHESVAEVSGAVEIDENTLLSIERGEKLPSEDILMLLVSHLGVEDKEAKKLFELADVGRQSSESITFDEQFIKQMLMIIPVDNRILYSDGTKINVNKNGVVINFQQSGDKQTFPIARIGMSKEHARKFAKVLTETIDKSEMPPKQKLLSAPKNK
jgi:transcriptional regulator with XRE-family HTH domain